MSGELHRSRDGNGAVMRVSMKFSRTVQRECREQAAAACAGLYKGPPAADMTSVFVC